MSVALSFPDGTYSSSNKPSVATLKNDLSLIEDDLNAHEADTTIHFTRAQINAPQGFLINGKISVTDTGSGLTVAIKTLAGTDPSASDSVYVRIGDTVRTISAALSVTKADGTNWCNAGSAELATKEIDYFVYLGYNATDGVVIGFSRYPGANSYDDFSATTTNEKHCAISTITNAAATDYYEVIGRFAATLSAGAGYTWSVPTYTAKNLIQRPIYETRWLDYSPVEVGWSGTLTFALASYKITMNQLFLNLNTNNGTSDSATTSLTVPFSSVNEYSFANALAIDNGSVVAAANRAVISTGAATLTFYKDMASTGWTSSGTKRVAHIANYEI